MAAPKPNPAPKPNRQVLFVAAALCIALVAGLGGFLAGQTVTEQAAPPPGHHRRAAVPTAPTAPRPPRHPPAVRPQASRSSATARAAMFSIWVAFGPPDGGGTMCTVGGRSGYSRGIVIMVRSDLANKKPGKAPTIGTKGGRVAFSFGEYACTWNISNSSVKPFKPGETRSIIGLVEPAADPKKQKLVLTVVRPGKPPYELATIPYASMFA